MVGKIALIDYGLGNLLSVRNALEYCGGNVVITNDCNEIYSADQIILPGVGAFSYAMNALRKLSLIDVIKNSVHAGKPILGICLGMQLLFNRSSEFGATDGLGILDGEVIKIPNDSGCKIPHIGWTEINPSNYSNNWQGTILEGLSSGVSTYFIHSYMAKPVNPDIIIAKCQYYDVLIPSVVQQNNIQACQFHPEKSSEVGLLILSNFINQ